MSKSLGNAIYLSDDQKTVKQKVMGMYTDPGHLRIEDKGKVEGNVVFRYLDVFAPDDPTVARMKEHYQAGGLGDVVVKQYLIKVLEEILSPIRARRAVYSSNMESVKDILINGNKKANQIANSTLKRVRKAIGIEYFE